MRSLMPPDLECITTDEGLHAIYNEWHALWSRLYTTPFQSPAWQLAWWKQFGTGRPIVAAMRMNGALMGLLPTYVLDEGGAAKILPIGAGISDTLDALIAPEAPPDTAEQLLSTVLVSAYEVSTCDLIDLPPSSRLRNTAIPQEWQAELHAGAPCPVLCFPEGMRALRQAIPSTTHRKLRMNRHRAIRHGGYTLEQATEATLKDSLDILFRLNEARWSAKGEKSGILADSRVGACLRAAAPALLQAEVLHLQLLRIHGEVAAACVSLASGPDRIMLYMSGFSEAYAYCSPGSLLLGEIAEQALCDGRRELHFLRGAEAYKYAWGAVDQHNATRHITRS